MDRTNKKTVTRVLSKTESRYLFELFEQVHCYKLNEAGECVNSCPGWDWDLQHLDEHDQQQPGGCRYRDSAKLCKNLELASDDFYVIEIRPKNEDDIRREKEIERTMLERNLRDLKSRRTEVEEAILAIENKMRSL